MNDITLRHLLKQEYITLKENLFLVEFKNRKYVLKGKRLNERNSLEKFRFKNELRFYSRIKELNKRNNYLNIPDHFISSDPEVLLLDFIKSADGVKLQKLHLVKSYYEFQSLQLKKNIVVGPYHQIINNFFYRVGIVSLRTISKKIDPLTGFKAFLLYIKLYLKQKDLKNYYLVHGDLNDNNFFYNNKGDLFFIDFENIFYTKKWPFAEIFSKCFTFTLDDKVNFDSKLLELYISEFNKNSQVQISYLLQCRFGLLFHSVREIAQTRNAERRKKYNEFLKISLDRTKFLVWYTENVEKHLKKQ